MHGLDRGMTTGAGTLDPCAWFTFEMGGEAPRSRLEQTSAARIRISGAVRSTVGNGMVFNGVDSWERLQFEISFNE